MRTFMIYFYQVSNAQYSIIFLLKTLKNFFLMFTFERLSTSAGGASERDTQNPKQAPGSELSAEPDVGFEPMNHNIMT